MKVAIIGSRDFKNKELLDSTMKKLQENIIIEPLADSRKQPII